MTHGFFSWQLVLAMGLNCGVQALSIAAYAARLAGVRSGRVATAISLFNMFATASRFAQMLYTPLLGSLSDRATAASLDVYQWQLRAIVIAGTVGAVLGTALIPTFVAVYLRAITALERHGSATRAMLRMFVPRVVFSLAREMRFGIGTPIRKLPFRNVPKDILILNTLVTAVYGVGIVAATYASVLFPQAARTAVLSSGLVNGIAVIAYNIIIDPTAALITDRAVRGDGTVEDVKALVAGLAISAILGFVLSQLLLVPGAIAIAYVARIITAH